MEGHADAKVSCGMPCTLRVPFLSQCCIQKMWLGGQTESFHNVGGGGEGVYDVLTFQKSRGQELT